MTLEDNVEFYRRQVEQVRKHFPADRVAVADAELKYERALNEAVRAGSLTVHGSDVTLEECSVRASLHCDGVYVTASFYLALEKMVGPMVFTRAEAVELGEQVAKSGVYKRIPIRVPTTAIKSFGRKLKEYGENCR